MAVQPQQKKKTFMCDQCQNIFKQEGILIFIWIQCATENFFENIEQLDGHASLPLDSSTKKSDKTIEEDLDLAYLPTADDPDNIFQN